MARGHLQSAEEILYGASSPRAIIGGSPTRQDYWPLKVDLTQLLVDDQSFFVGHRGYSGNFFWGVHSEVLPTELNLIAKGRIPRPQQRKPEEDEIRWIDQFLSTAFADDGLKPVEFVSELHRKDMGGSWWLVTPEGGSDQDIGALSVNAHVVTFIEQQSKTVAEWLYNEVYFDKIRFRTMIYVDRTHSENQLLGWYMID